MKKIGKIRDELICKEAQASGPEAIKVVNQHIKSKIAMLAVLVDAAERESGRVLDRNVKKAIVKTASQYIPMEFLSQKGQAENVFKYADAILTRIFMSGVKKKGSAMFDIPATKKAQAELRARKKATIDSNIDAVEPNPAPGAKDQQGNPEPAADLLVEENMVDAIFDNMGVQGAPEHGKEEGKVQAAGTAVDSMAGVNAPVSKPDPSNPNPASTEHSAVDLNDVDKQASATFERINEALDQYFPRKEAASGVAPAVPQNKPSEQGTAAEEADKEATEDVATNPELSKSVQMPAGEAMDQMADASGLEALERLLAEEGASEEDQTTPITAPEAIDSKDSERKVNAAKKTAKANANIFSTYLNNLAG